MNRLGSDYQRRVRLDTLALMRFLLPLFASVQGAYLVWDYLHLAESISTTLWLRLIWAASWGLAPFILGRIHDNLYFLAVSIVMLFVVPSSLLGTVLTVLPDGFAVGTAGVPLLILAALIVLQYHPATFAIGSIVATLILNGFALAAGESAAVLANLNFYQASAVTALTISSYISTRLHLRNYRLDLALRHRHRRAQLQAVTDALTRAFNRRHFLRLARLELDRSRRYERPISVLLVDADHFKSINDRFGHGVGDEALCILVDRIMTKLRSTDVLARIGGEEFAILLPETNLPAASALAERLRAACAAGEIETSTGASFSLTVSVGCAEVTAQEADISETMSRADRALYEAKSRGRNLVATALPGSPPDIAMALSR